MHIHQHVYIPFVLPYSSCQVTLHPNYICVTAFQFHVLAEVFCGIPFQFCQTVPQLFMGLVCKSLKNSGEEKNDLCTVYALLFQSL